MFYNLVSFFSFKLLVGKLRVLWHSMKNIVNLIRHLKSFKVLCLAKFKAENCSEQHSARHVFININSYRQQEIFKN
jgi:hypothetical protein